MGRRKAGEPRSRDLLIQSAGEGFRAGGFGGSGVDGISKRAGLTSGAFYAEFGSKAEAFSIAVQHGLRDLLTAIQAHQEKYGGDWLNQFLDFYLGDLMQAGLEHSCALPTFSADVIRSNDDTRAAFESVLHEIADSIADGLSGDNRKARALTLLSLLSGATNMARAVPDGSALRAQILNSAKAAALEMDRGD